MCYIQFERILIGVIGVSIYAWVFRADDRLSIALSISVNHLLYLIENRFWWDRLVVQNSLRLPGFSGGFWTDRNLPILPLGISK
jgi:hypothetical protein